MLSKRKVAGQLLRITPAINPLNPFKSMKTEKEKLMGKRAMLVDRRSNALNRKKYDQFTQLDKEIRALTEQIEQIVRRDESDRIAELKRLATK